MDEKHNRPVSRDDLELTIEFALRKACRQRPTRRTPGDHDFLLSMAVAVVDHLKFCDMGAFRIPPAPSHTTTAVGDVDRRMSSAEEQLVAAVAWTDLESTINTALKQTRRSWPKGRLPGEHTRLRPLARRVADQLESARLHVFQEISPAPPKGRARPEIALCL